MNKFLLKVDDEIVRLHTYGTSKSKDILADLDCLFADRRLVFIGRKIEHISRKDKNIYYNFKKREE